MSLEVACPSCHVVLSLPPDGEGSQLTCGGCGQLFAVAARRVESPARRPGGRLSQRKILLWAVVCPAVSFLVFVAVAAVVVHLRGPRHDVPESVVNRENYEKVKYGMYDLALDNIFSGCKPDVRVIWGAERAEFSVLSYREGDRVIRVTIRFSDGTVVDKSKEGF